MAGSRKADLRRQIAVSVGAGVGLVGVLLALFGTNVPRAAGGSLSANATLLAPATPAFSIWSAIYTGLFTYTAWQWLPQARTDVRARSIGWLAAASLLLNGAWLLVVQAGWIWASVGVIFALVVVLGETMRRIGKVAPSGWLDGILLDGTFGLYLGWVCVATCANVTAALVASGVNPSGWVAELIAVAVLVVVSGIGWLLAIALKHRLAVAVAMCWGLGWIAFGRLFDAPRSVPTALVAVVALVAILAITIRLRARALRRRARTQN